MKLCFCSSEVVMLKNIQWEILWYLSTSRGKHNLQYSFIEMILLWLSRDSYLSCYRSVLSDIMSHSLFHPSVPLYRTLCTLLYRPFRHTIRPIMVWYRIGCRGRGGEEIIGKETTFEFNLFPDLLS